MPTFVRCSEYLPSLNLKEIKNDWEKFRAFTKEIYNQKKGGVWREEFCTQFMNFSRQHGLTPLHIAARYDDVRSIRRIARITRRNFLNIGTEDGRTALHFAAYWGRIRAVETLIRLGALINVVACPQAEKIKWGNSVLSKATSEWRQETEENRDGRMQCAATLRKAGAVYNEEGDFPDHVPYGRKWEVEKLLQEEAVLIDAVYKAPHLQCVPLEVLDIVARFANLPDRSIATPPGLDHWP